LSPCFCNWIRSISMFQATP
jgi:hypothetical protein